MELLTPHEFAAHWGVRYKTVLTWINDGRVNVIRTPGGRIRIPRKELERLKADG